MKIKVKRKHIDAGMQNESELCPIALACAEAGLNGVCVDDDGTIMFDDGENQKLYCLASDVLKPFVNDFDNHLNVEPFEFEIREDRIWTRKRPAE